LAKWTSTSGLQARRGTSSDSPTVLYRPVPGLATTAEAELRRPPLFGPVGVESRVICPSEYYGVDVPVQPLQCDLGVRKRSVLCLLWRLFGGFLPLCWGGSADEGRWGPGVPPSPAAPPRPAFKAQGASNVKTHTPKAAEAAAAAGAVARQTSWRPWACRSTASWVACPELIEPRRWRLPAALALFRAASYQPHRESVSKKKIEGGSDP